MGGGRVGGAGESAIAVEWGYVLLWLNGFVGSDSASHGEAEGTKRDGSWTTTLEGKE